MAERSVTIEGGLRGTLTEAAAPSPCVVLLHGFGGHRDETGGLFAKLAARLSERAVASLRIDFPGCGASPGDFADTTIGRYTDAALAAIRYACASPAIEAARIGLVGFSFGGAIAAACVQRGAPIKALALWAAVGNPKLDMIESIGAARAAEAERQGWTELPWGGRKVRLKRSYFASLAEATPLEALAEYEGDLFVAAGGRDRLAKYVPLLAAGAPRARSRRERIIEGADHFFGAQDPAGGFVEPLLSETTDFLASSLRRA